uniref:Protein kinase domain-containing protein n=1 Tax=Parascaris equorum TaxID=6256 RepID=A0A914REG3_PAREQ
MGKERIRLRNRSNQKYQVAGLDVYMVLDLMETDLHQIIHSRQNLMDQHFQYFLYQILRGLKQYVSTRWYRAPELLFSLIDYNTKVDIWSAGCIFAEMILRRQLFPGKDAISQVKMIVYYLGTPEKRPLAWSSILPKANPKAVDLIAKVYFDAEAIEKLPVNVLKDALIGEAEYFASMRSKYAQSESTQPCTSTDETAEKCKMSTESTIKDVAMMSCKLDECEIQEEDRDNKITDGRFYPDFKRHKWLNYPLLCEMR